MQPRVYKLRYCNSCGGTCGLPPEKVSENKIKSENLTVEFVKNSDIAKSLGEVKGNKRLIIFAAETENLLDNAKGKLLRKHADLVVANDVTAKGAGFEVDTNIATLIDSCGNISESGKVSKRQLADLIIDKVLAL